MISFQNVSYRPSPSEPLILDDVSFTVGKGEFVLIVGRTGTGKSVISKLLNGELKPDSGEIRVGNITISTLRGSALQRYRRSIGCIYHDLPLLEDKTVAENIAFALEVIKKRGRASIHPKVEHVLNEVGLWDKALYYPRRLSLGERQRVSIARALVIEPLVLLADSATSQLDPESRKEIFSILENEHIRGMTILKMMNEKDPFVTSPKGVRWLELRNGKVEDFLPVTGGANVP
jgi:cell division transport system ATP-binding protein